MKLVLTENSLPCVLSSAAFATPEIYNFIDILKKKKVDNNLILDDEATLECPGP